MEKLNEVIDFYEMTGDEPELLVMLLELRRHRLDNWKQRAEAAEAHATEGWRVAHEVGAECDQLNARLAELVKRPPVGDFYEDGPGNWWQIGPHDKVPHVTPLFTRPAPAADLAELLPEEKETERQDWTVGDWVLHVGGRYKDDNPMNYVEFGSMQAVAAMIKQVAKAAYIVGFNACRAEILRSIAEAQRLNANTRS